MKTPFTLICLLSLLWLTNTSCSTAYKKALSSAKTGEAVILQQNGQFSKAMHVKDAFAKLKSNEKMYLKAGRVILKEPIDVKNLANIDIIGNDTWLVAKVDMPVLTLRDVANVRMEKLTVVHEIGEWCAQNCVEFYSAANLTITDCKFDGSGYFGLALSKVANATISDNQFFNCEFGLAAWDCANLIVKDNTFSKNRDEDIQVNARVQFSNDFEKENTFK